jgi:hypothetical protein
MWTLLSIFLLITLFWYWFDGLRAREIAMAVCREMCRYRQVQLLDETVMLFRTRVRRSPDGKLRLQRTFGFEVTTNGDDRDPGAIIMLGSHMQLFELGEDRTILLD